MSEDIRKLIDKVKNYKQVINENNNNNLLVYHGTKPKFVDTIKFNGLEDKSGSPYSQGWYMVSSDFESALFHAHPDDMNNFVYVFEFEIPITDNDRWIGYPYLWKGNKINDNSTWYALMQKIPKEYIKKIHKISYNNWVSQKNIGF